MVNVILLILTVEIITLNKRITLKNDLIVGLNEGDNSSFHDHINSVNAEDELSPDLNTTALWKFIRASASATKFKVINHPICWRLTSAYFHTVITMWYFGGLI